MLQITKEIVDDLRRRGVALPKNDSFWQLLYNFLFNRMWYSELTFEQRMDMWNHAAKLLQTGRATVEGKEAEVLDVFPRSPDYRQGKDYILVTIRYIDNYRQGTVGISKVS